MTLFEGSGKVPGPMLGNLRDECKIGTPGSPEGGSGRTPTTWAGTAIRCRFHNLANRELVRSLGSDVSDATIKVKSGTVISNTFLFHLTRHARSNLQADPEHKDSRIYKIVGLPTPSEDGKSIICRVARMQGGSVG